eukprot:207489-Pelagomonas_calceolata.AAC.1
MCIKLQSPTTLRRRQGHFFFAVLSRLWAGHKTSASATHTERDTLHALLADAAACFAGSSSPWANRGAGASNWCAAPGSLQTARAALAHPMTR